MAVAGVGFESDYGQRYRETVRAGDREFLRGLRDLLPDGTPMRAVSYGGRLLVHLVAVNGRWLWVVSTSTGREEQRLRLSPPGDCPAVLGHMAVDAAEAVVWVGWDNRLVRLHLNVRFSDTR